MRNELSRFESVPRMTIAFRAMHRAAQFGEDLAANGVSQRIECLHRNIEVTTNIIRCKARARPTREEDVMETTAPAAASSTGVDIFGPATRDAKRLIAFYRDVLGMTRFRAQGATLGDPFETTVCFISFGKDPDGTEFGIHQRKKRD
jgi:hypothetical protein